MTFGSTRFVVGRSAFWLWAVALAAIATSACGSAPPPGAKEPATAVANAEPATRAGSSTTTGAEAAAPATSAASTATSSSAASEPAAQTGEPKEIGARHVLIQYMGAQRAEASVVRTREQAQTLAQEVLKRARGGEDFARLAVEYSDEPNAGARGGSLGRFRHGQMVPAFEEVAFKLRVGQISDVIETSFGFHVIQRTE